MVNREAFGLILVDGGTVPLVGVAVDAHIAGRGCGVKVVQTFANRENKPVEAVYKFPLPENSAVCGFRVKVGGRVILSEVEEREKAFEMYDKALEEGHGGFLLDEERPNIFTLSVGNLEPGTAAEIELHYVCLLETHGDEVRFFLPTTISPRYIPDHVSDDDGIPVDDKVNPPFAENVPYGLKLGVTVDDPGSIAAVESPSHPVTTTFDDAAVHITLSAETEEMDRDFVLSIRRRKRFGTRAYCFNGEKGCFVQIDVAPDSTSDNERVAVKAEIREVIFVLDCSGSMSGPSIEQAKKAIGVLVRALPVGVRFNIYRFGSTFEKLFPLCKAYDTGSAKKAITYVEKIDADLGGTEVLSPIRDICAQEIPADVRRDVILVTDGEVGNEDEVASHVRDNGKGIRFFPVGIGYGPNEYFMKQLARVSGGAAEMIAPNERIEPKVLRLFGKVTGYSVTNIALGGALKSSQAPADPAAYEGETISVFARVDGGVKCPPEITVSALSGKMKKEWTIGVCDVTDVESPIARLWARETIRDLEEGTGFMNRGSRQKERKEQQTNERIIALSKEFGILSRLTSFVAVEYRSDKDKTTENAVLRKVPVMLTKGWHGHGSLSLIASESTVVCSMSEPPDYQQASSSVSCCMREDREQDRIEEPSSLMTAAIRLLSCQRPEGGFHLDEWSAVVIGVSVKELKQTARRIVTRSKTDRYTLLCTAVVMTYLTMRHADDEQEWKALAEKSRAWLDAELVRTGATLDGQPLLDWAKGYVENLHIK